MTGQQIMRDVCMEFAIDPDEIMIGGKRKAIITEARRAIIRRMRDGGFSLRNIARFLKVDASAVSYHLYEARRQNVQRNARACYARKRAA